MDSAEFTRFYNDLKAAVVAGVPLEIGDGSQLASSPRLTVTELERWERTLQSLISNDSCLRKALDTQPDLPRRYRAALLVFDQTGSMVPVLDGLTTRRLARNKVTRILRGTFVYLLLVLLVAFLGLRLFDVAIVPAVEDMRVDLLLPAAISAPTRFDPLPWLPAIVGVLGVGIVLALIWLLFGGASKAALWLGGHQFVRCQVSATAVQTLPMLIASGMDMDESVSVSCDLVGADERTRREIQAAAQYPEGSQHWGALADYFSILASRRLAYMKVATPIALVTSVGGGIAALYGIIIFWPIISMLKDLATAGT